MVHDNERIKRRDIPEHSHIELAFLPSELVANVLLNNVPSLSTIGGMEQLFARDVVLSMARWRYSFSTGGTVSGSAGMSNVRRLWQLCRGNQRAASVAVLI
jgi:hypothetical protein